MDQFSGFLKNFDRTKLLTPLTACYFFLAIIEIIAELKGDRQLIAFSKPLLMPLMIMVYLSASRKTNLLFVFSMLAAWIANIFLISGSMNMIMVGTFCFLAYRLLIILMVMRITKFPGYVPLLIGSLPFLFLYLFVTNLTYRELDDHLPIFVVQGVLLIFFGGFCLGSYILKSSRSHTMLLISTILFTGAQFLIFLKLYYVSFTISQPLAMLFYTSGQYLLYLYVLIEEKKKRRYKSIKAFESSPAQTAKQDAHNG